MDRSIWLLKHPAIASSARNIFNNGITAKRYLPSVEIDGHFIAYIDLAHIHFNNNPKAQVPAPAGRRLQTAPFGLLGSRRSIRQMA